MHPPRVIQVVPTCCNPSWKIFNCISVTRYLR